MRYPPDEVAFVRAATWPDFIKRSADYTNDGEDPRLPGQMQAGKSAIPTS
jgi:hypothetical protein